MSKEWATDDVLFYTTLEALRCSTVTLSRDRQILSINGNSRSSSEVLLIDGTTSHLEPFLVQPRQPDLLYHVEHWRESLVLQSPLSEPSMASWVPLFTPDSALLSKTWTSAAGGLVLIVVSLTNPKEAYTVQDGTLVPVTLFHSVPVGGLRQAPYSSMSTELMAEISTWKVEESEVSPGTDRLVLRGSRVEWRTCEPVSITSSLQESPLLLSLPSQPAARGLWPWERCAPFLDVLGTMEDPSLPLTLEDREEWGDPVGFPEHRLIISSYSPNIVLNIQPGENHLGPEDFELMLEEEALRLAFLYTELGLEPPRPQRKRRR
ncbi:hypothetical protein F7725_023838 [Dissostichus mawsoni]|uniref:Uncharacterized protein n=1 Tax=Dissostichus mawsoni TaxID=36200 RepID=A0A7J5XZG9_DISMA|nr:hypothetical protein F7725_023838 [Dissostichus mawsoni]